MTDENGRPVSQKDNARSFAPEGAKLPHELILIDLDRIRENDIGLVEECHSLWVETYKPILEAAGESLHSDGFFRSRVLMAVRQGDVLVGFCLARFFDLRVSSMAKASYFDPMPEVLLRGLSEQGDRVFAVEWVTVRPEQRAKFSKVQLADLIMGVSTRFMLETESDFVMGFSRTDLGADRIAACLGIRPHGIVNFHGIDCQVMIGRREWVGAHRFAVVERAIEDLWARRQDYYFGAAKGQESRTNEKAA